MMSNYTSLTMNSIVNHLFIRLALVLCHGLNPCLLWLIYILYIANETTTYLRSSIVTTSKSGVNGPLPMVKAATLHV